MKKLTAGISVIMLTITSGCSSSGGGGGNPTAAPAPAITTTLGSPSSDGIAVANNRTQDFSVVSSGRNNTTIRIGNRTYSVATRSNLTPGVQSSTTGDIVYVPSGAAGIKSGRYADTSIYFLGSNLTNSRTARATSVGATVTGTLTPVQNLPSVAVYSGNWNSGLTQNGRPIGAGEIGRFSATANFGQRKEVTGTFRDNTGQTIIRMDADIKGNQFEGKFKDTSNRNISDVEGGFFGPNAEEIAGASSVTQAGEGIAISFIGTKR